MKKINNNILIVIFILTARPLTGQDKNPCSVNTSLAIDGVVDICVGGNQSDHLWLIENLIYGIPRITETGLDIKIGTNTAAAIFYLESSGASGNLTNGPDELATAYLLTLMAENSRPCPQWPNEPLKTEPPPTSLDPRWKSGHRLRQFVQKIDRPGYHTWRLYARLFADSSCNYGSYRDELTIVVLDNSGKRHIKKVGIQAELHEKSVIDRLRSDGVRPDLVENVKPGNPIQFMVTSTEPVLQLVKSGNNQGQIGFIPITMTIPQDLVPCTILIESDNAKNYFANQYHHLKKTSYYLSAAAMEIQDLTGDCWQDGVLLRSLLQRITTGGEYHWQLWVKIQEEVSSTFTNTFNVIVMDARGKRYSHSIDVTFE